MSEPIESSKAKTVVVRCDVANLDRARQVMAERLGIPTLSDRAVLDIALQAYDPTERWNCLMPEGESAGVLLEIPEVVADSLRSEARDTDRTLEDIFHEIFSGDIEIMGSRIQRDTS